MKITKKEKEIREQKRRELDEAVGAILGLKINENLTQTAATAQNTDTVATESILPFVDLGRAGVWAKCNLGANNPWDFGDYYAWGELEPYKEGDDTYIYDQYPPQKIYSQKNRMTDLDFDSDAAYQKSNGLFRMPNTKDIRKLLKWSDREQVKMNGVWGIKFISKKNKDNFIFLPYCGEQESTDIDTIGENGNYWMATAKPKSVYRASFSQVATVLHLSFSFGSDDGSAFQSYTYRTHGCPIRGIKC